jgi:RND family efflux transporter MFP subunit
MSTGTPPAPSRRAGLAGLALIVLLAAAFAWYLRNDAPRSADAPVAGGEPLELTATEVVTVSHHELVRRLPVSGSLAPLLRTVVKSKVPGEILEVAVREGMPVRAGEPLMRLDTRGLAARVASMRAALEKARADLAIARLNHENARMLFDKKVLAQNELDTKRSVYEAAQAAVRLAEAELRVVEITLEDAAITAPFDAVVARRFVDPGGKVSPDTALFELVDLAHMELQAAAPASEIPALRPGQVARVRVDGFGERVFEARLERINPTAEQGSRLILLYLSIDNSEGLLRGGMFAQGDVLIERSEPRLAIPESAIVAESGIDYVMAIRDGRAERVRVQLGMRAANDQLVEVREGLAEGTQVIALSLPSLEPGSPVRVVATAAAN